ncbi:MAG: CoA transferase [Burkholderiales bacterium]|nr:CoA transferase [Burkholderiales bacterium]
MDASSRIKAQGPLAQCRVLELGSTIAGPFCGRLLADFGADVVKVEVPEGDALRSMGNRIDGRSLYAATLLRNKSVAAIDLRQGRGQALVRTMAARCDILIENFRPGAMEKWGLGYDVLARANPGLVMVRISGFGQTGPYSQRAGYGVVAEAVSGLRSLIGDADRPPARVAIPLTDYITGLYAALGALMALQARQVTGRGQVVDAALYEAAFSFLEQLVPSYQKLGIVAQRSGSRMENSAPNNLYACADAQYVHITAIADGVFRRLLGVMGRDDLAGDARFATAIERARHMDEIDDIIAAWSRTLPATDAETRLNAAGVPAARVFTVADAFADAHFQARGMLTEVPDAELGTVTLASPVPKLSDTPGRIRHAGPRLGHDTAAVLRELAGLEDAQIEALARDGVIRLPEMNGNKA